MEDEGWSRMTTGQSAFTDALQRAQSYIDAPGFNTLTANQKHIAVLRRAVREAGGEPVGTSFPSTRDEPVVIEALETQLRKLLDAANIAPPYNEGLIRDAAPAITVHDDPRLLATEGGTPPAEPLPPSAYASDPLSAQHKAAISEAYNRLQGSPGYHTLPFRHRPVALLRLAVRNAGGEPVGPEFPRQEDLEAVTEALSKQLEALLNVSKLEEPYRSAYVDERTPQISISNDPRFIATEISSQPQGAYVDPALKQQFYTLQDEVRALGAEPEVTSYLSPAHLGRHIETLRAQLRRLALLSDARSEIEGSSLDASLFDEQELEIMARQQAIRDLGESPVVSGSVRPDERAGALSRLKAQLRSLVNPSTEQTIAPEEFSFESDFAPDLPEPTEYEKELETRRQEERDAAFRSELVDGDGTGWLPSKELVDTFKRLKPYFPGGELDALFGRLYLNVDAEEFFNPEEFSPADQVKYFLDQVGAIYGLKSHFIGVGDAISLEDQIKAQFGSYELSLRRNSQGQTLYEAGSNPAKVLAEQWIPDSVVEGLPGPLRAPIQSLLDYTSPIGALSLAATALLTGGTGAVASVVAHVATDTVTELLWNSELPIGQRQLIESLIGEGVGRLPGISGALGDLSDEKELLKAIFNLAGGHADEAGKASLRAYAENLIEGSAKSGKSLLLSFALDMAFAAVEQELQTAAARGPVARKIPDVEGHGEVDSILGKALSPYDVAWSDTAYNFFVNDAGRYPWSGTIESVEDYFRNTDDPVNSQNRVTYEMLGTIAATVVGRDDLPPLEHALAMQALGKKLRVEPLSALEKQTLEKALGGSFDKALDRARANDSIARARRDALERSQTLLSPAPPEPEPVPEIDPRKTIETAEAAVNHIYGRYGLSERQLTLLTDTYYKLVNGIPLTRDERATVDDEVGAGYLGGLEAMLNQG
jgi:hypothetical protein